MPSRPLSAQARAPSRPSGASKQQDREHRGGTGLRRRAPGDRANFAADRHAVTLTNSPGYAVMRTLSGHLPHVTLAGTAPFRQGRGPSITNLCQAYVRLAKSSCRGNRMPPLTLPASKIRLVGVREIRLRIIVERKRIFGAHAFGKIAVIAQIDHDRMPGCRKRARILNGEQHPQVLVVIIGIIGSAGAPVLLGAARHRVLGVGVVDQE